MRPLLASLLLSSAVVACGPGAPSGECTACGDDSCVDVATDPQHCGGCGTVCGAGEACVDGACEPAAADCPTPGATEPCYGGPVGSEGVGECAGGTRTCGDDGSWGGCVGEVTPSADLCGDGLDQDCDGQADETTDEDGDGFTTCGGDCCDSGNDGCAQPEKVNPAAIEVAGNQLDDDCDGTVDNETTSLCDTGLNSGSSDPFDYAKAMDLCQRTTEDTGLWGVVSARFVRVDGTGAPVASQRSIRSTFGGVPLQGGAAMAVLSTGAAAAVGQSNPSYAPFDSLVHGTTSGFPADWLSANGGSLPNAPGCPEPFGTSAEDPVMLELTVRAPSNAASFSMSINFMSAEFPEYTCSPYNDFFVVLLDSAWAGTPANPADKNLAFYKAGNGTIYPVGVNLAYGNTGLFRQCENGSTGCALGSTPGSISTCVSTAELAGTGMDVLDGGCGSNDQLGGGTGWLVTSGNVVGGELIRLRIGLWDTSDGLLDSLAFVDNFRWSLSPSEPGTVIDVD